MKKLLKNPNLMAVIDFYADGNQKKFAEITGIGTINVHNALYRNKTISADHIDKILTAFPKINIQFLMQKSNVMHLDLNTSAGAPTFEKVVNVIPEQKVIKMPTVSDAQNRFIATIDKWRFKHNNTTYTEVANRLQIQTSALSEIRGKTRNISLDLILRASVVMNINPNYILLGISPEFMTNMSTMQSDAVLTEKLKGCEEKCQILQKNLDDIRNNDSKKVSKKVSVTDKVKKVTKRK